jgi:hypothetical protein
MALDLSSSLLLASEKERKRGKTAEEPRTERRKEPVVGESSSWILLCDRYSTIEVVDGCGSTKLLSRWRTHTHTHRASLSFPILWLLWLYSRVPLSFLIVVVVVVGGELCITVEVAAAAAGLGLFDVGLVSRKQA